MLADALMAWLHYMLIFALCGCLFAEAFFYQAEFGRATLARLQRVDLAYGIIAGAVVASGVARVFVSPKGALYYAHNPIFWTKIALVVVLGLLSIPPTIHFIRLRNTVGSNDRVVVGASTYGRMRAYLTAEIAFLLLIPCCAALMARGFGWSG